jgi:hypothetical protein
LDTIDDRLAALEATLADADVVLSTDLGGYQQRTQARVWRGQVLVDWEPDREAGDLLLRPELLRRLIALHATVQIDEQSLTITAPGRIVAGVSAAHADLVKRLGGARRVALRATLRFAASGYRGGDETYLLVERGQASPLLRLSAEVTLREASPRTSPARS